MSARDEIIGRIRAARGNLPAPIAPASVAPAYRRASGAERADIVARFVERLADYSVGVLHAGSEMEVREVAGAQIARRGIDTLVIPPDLPMSWRPLGASLLEDAGFAPEELDRIPGAMTGSLLGIAETGSVVLDCGPGQGRRALSLLPDYHLCVVRAGALVAIVPEAIAALHPRVLQGAPITFISGPSATADIELDRVEGVHGPRTLDVILVA